MTENSGGRGAGGRGAGEGPILGVKNEIPRREIKKSDLVRMNLGKSLWNASIDKIQDIDARQVFANYISNIRNMIKTCSGLLIFGNRGVGKSGAAAVIAMEAVKVSCSAYVISHQELQEVRFDPKGFNDSQTVMDRVRSVHLLVLDNFNDDFLEDRRFGMLDLEKLVSRRKDNMLTTILTTSINRFDDKFTKSLTGVIKAALYPVGIEGKDFRDVEMERLHSRIKHQ